MVFHSSKNYETIDNEITNMVRFNDVKKPIMQNVGIYKKLYRYFTQTLIDIDKKKRVAGKL